MGIPIFSVPKPDVIIKGSQKMPKKRETLASRLRAKREAAGLTWVALAKAAGCSEDQIARLESGRAVSPSLRTLRGLAAALGCTVGELVD
jgi:transcriptional regulator with XRE-family HTH domain